MRVNLFKIAIGVVTAGGLLVTAYMHRARGQEPDAKPVIVGATSGAITSMANVLTPGKISIFAADDYPKVKACAETVPPEYQENHVPTDGPSYAEFRNAHESNLQISDLRQTISICKSLWKAYLDGRNDQKDGKPVPGSATP